MDKEDRVFVRAAELKAGINTVGLFGTVVDKYSDSEWSFAAVRLHVSPIYKPTFWYNQSQLDITSEALEYPGALKLYDAIVGRGTWSPPAAWRSRRGASRRITLGWMQAWVFSQCSGKEDSLVAKRVKELNFDELTLFMGNPPSFNRWLSENDTRIRRAQISKTEVVAEPIAIRRPKMGGS